MKQSNSMTHGGRLHRILDGKSDSVIIGMSFIGNGLICMIKMERNIYAIQID